MVLVQQEFNMENVSPVLPEGTKNYLIDTDGSVMDTSSHSSHQEPKNIVK